MGIIKLPRLTLGLKVLLLVSALTVGAFVGLFIYNSYQLHLSVLEEIHRTAQRTSDMLRMAIEEPMGIGDNEGTAEKFTTLQVRYSDILAHLVDYKGEITYSTEPEAVRKDFYQYCDNEDCLNLVRQGLSEEVETGVQTTVRGAPHFVEVKTIPNEPACHHCHGSSRPILGAMIMYQDISEQMGGLSSSQIKSAGISLAGLAALLAALLTFMKLAVVNRIRAIGGSAQQVSEGDLDAAFAMKGDDELARLAHNLQEMVRQIKDQLQYNKSVLTGIIVPMFVADAEEKMEFVNEPLQAILGGQESDFIGHPLPEVLCDVDNQACHAGAVIATGETASGNMRYRRNDGVIFPLHYEISPLRGAQGKVLGAIGVLIDLTQEEQDRKNIEAQQQNLLEVANQVTQVAMKLEGASEQLQEEMRRLTQGVDSTADETGRVATAMEEMNATVLEVAKNAGNTAEASEKANQVASEGGRVVQSTVDEIHGVAQTTEDFAKTLAELADRAENIGQVMAVINDIADQTNLLALNAAIEAARAGEAGRGFAVVADEVRKLAEKTMHATKEVEDAVSQIQDATGNVVGEMDNTRTRVVRTAEMAEEAGGVLKEVVSQADRIADMVRNIATAAEQQSATSDEINTNVTHINDLSQELSQSIQKANASITGVAGMARNLAELVAKFRDRSGD